MDEINLLRLFHENTKRNIYYTSNEPDFNEKPPSFKEYPDLPRVALPKDNLSLKMSLEDAILNRRSWRAFLSQSLDLDKLSNLLWFSYGITELMTYKDFEITGRPAPSAGALNPCEIYPVILNVENIEKGLYHYCAIDHSLERLKGGDFSNRLAQLFMGQRYISSSNVCFVFTTVLKRTTWKYGARGYRYLLLDLGHLAQNICLAATALNLVTLPLGGFYDDSTANFMGVDPRCEPVQYGLAVGYKGEEIV